jgi:hypothetical protein
MTGNNIPINDEQDAMLEASFRSRGVRIGAGLFTLGFFGGMVGVGDYMTDSSEFASELIAGSYITMLAGLGISAASGIRAANNYNNSRTQEQNPQA